MKESFFLEKLDKQISLAYLHMESSRQDKDNLAHLRKTLVEERAKLRALNMAVEKEASDVAELERNSFQAFLLSVLGLKKEQLETERFELRTAKLLLEQLEAHIKQLEKELPIFELNARAHRSATAAYESLLATKEQYLVDKGGDVGRELFQLAKEIERTQGLILLVERADKEGRLAVHDMDILVQTLQQAILSRDKNLVKYRHHYRFARDRAIAVQTQIRRYEFALHDQQVQAGLKPDIKPISPKGHSILEPAIPELRQQHHDYESQVWAHTVSRNIEVSQQMLQQRRIELAAELEALETKRNVLLGQFHEVFKD